MTNDGPPRPFEVEVRLVLMASTFEDVHFQLVDLMTDKRVMTWGWRQIGFLSEHQNQHDDDD